MNHDVLIGFVGNTFGPLFLVDPEQGAFAPLASAILALDPAQAGEAWPFVEAGRAAHLLDQMQQGLQGDRLELIWEFRRLFAIGQTPKPAPPWGSFYTDKDGAICSEATFKLRSWLKARGIGLADAHCKVEDHIGQMLVLLAWIADKRPELLSVYLSEHLLTWCGHFLELLASVTTHPFYRALAQLCNASLCGMREELALEIIYPHFYR